MKKNLQTDKAPIPLFPYSQAVMASGTFMFISGQIPIDLAGNVVGNDIATQTRQVITNIKAILEAYNLTLSNVVKTTVFITDMNNFAEMNKVYEEFFKDSKPARSAFQVSRLPKDVLVEIEAIAVMD